VSHVSCGRLADQQQHAQLQQQLQEMQLQQHVQLWAPCWVLCWLAASSSCRGGAPCSLCRWLQAWARWCTAATRMAAVAVTAVVAVGAAVAGALLAARQQQRLEKQPGGCCMMGGGCDLCLQSPPVLARSMKAGLYLHNAPGPPLSQHGMARTMKRHNMQTQDT
jgi:hypothetical protein